MASDIGSEKYQAAEPLLHNEARLSVLQEEQCQVPAVSLPGKSESSCDRLFGFLPWYLHGFLILVYSTFFFLLYISTFTSKDNKTHLLPREFPEIFEAIMRRLQSNLSIVPAREALQWGVRYFPTNIVNNPFSGEPRPELHRAWHDLLRSMIT